MKSKVLLLRWVRLLTVVDEGNIDWFTFDGDKNQAG